MSSGVKLQPILMLSSNERLVRSSSSLLEPVGFSIVCQQRPRDFLLALKLSEWGMAVLDTSRAGASRAELVSAARMIDPTIPLLVLVPQNDLPFCVDALRLGATDVLTIPLQGVELKFRVAGHYGCRMQAVKDVSTAPTEEPLSYESEAIEEIPPSAILPLNSNDSPAVEGSKVHDLGLIHDVNRFHELCLKQFIGMEKRLLDMKEKLDRASGVKRTNQQHIQQTLLLVHSDPGLFNSLQRLTHPHSITVKQVYTGGEAFDSASQESIDLLICSDDLPDLGGEMVVGSLKSEHPYIDAVLLSSWGSPEASALWIDDEEDGLLIALPNEEALDGLIQAFVARRERRAYSRRLANVFKEDHREFMHRFNEIKLRMRQVLRKTSS